MWVWLTPKQSDRGDEVEFGEEVQEVGEQGWIGLVSTIVTRKLKCQVSNEYGGAMEMRVVLMSSRRIVAIQPPCPWFFHLCEARWCCLV